MANLFCSNVNSMGDEDVGLDSSVDSSVFLSAEGSAVPQEELPFLSPQDDDPQSPEPM